MLDQRLREGAEAVKAALGDAIPPAVDDVFVAESPAPRTRVGWQGPLIAIGTAAAVLAVVAAAAFLFQGDGSTGEPAAPEVSTTVTTTPAFVGDTVASWRVTDVAEPWVHSIVDVASLPGGGFVVAVNHSEANVLWSPDGFDWVEAHPYGEITATRPSEFDQQPQVIDVLADRVAVVDSGGPRVWLGDLAARTWESISLDTAGLVGDSRAWAIASNDHKILVVAKWSLVDIRDADEPAEDLADYVAWLIDPETGGVERHSLPMDESALGLAALWFEDRWVIAVGNDTAVSSDGMTWTLGFVSPPGDPAMVTSLTAGPGGILATTCRGWGGHPTFLSADGLEWTRVPEHEQIPEQAQAGHGGAAYSDDLGFVMVFADSGEDDDNLGRMDYSQNGRNWSSIDVGLGDNHDATNLAVSDTSIFVYGGLGASLLTPEWGTNSASAVTPSEWTEWPEVELPTSMPPVSGVEDGQTVSVTVSGVSDHLGHELAGVLYEGGELTNLDGRAVGGFWSVISDDDFTTTEVLRRPDEIGMGRFPFITDAALTVEPGIYTLVIWVDHALNPVSRRVPINTDGQGLYGCHVVFEVSNDTQTNVDVPANLHPDGWNTNCTTGTTIPGTDAASAVTPPEWNEWPELELPAEMPAVSGVGDGQTVSVTVSGVSGRIGHDLAGVLYEGGELTDLDRDPLGGFWSVISDDDFTTTEVVRQPGEMGMGRFPFISDEALAVEPGTYTLVIWVDHALNPVSRWVPINTDGQGLYGCHTVLEVGDNPQTDVDVPVDLHPDGWNTDCTTGATIPGTDAASAVNP